MHPSGDDRHGQAVTLFSQIPYFAPLDQETIAAIIQSATRREVQPDQVVLWEGETNHSLHVISSGWLKAVKMSPDGREQVLHVIEPGEVLNTIGVFTDAPHPGTVIALEPSVLWVIPRQVMLTLVESHPAMARVIIMELASRVQHLISLVEDLSLRTVESRLARLLLENAVEGIVERRRWATQAEIAARLGTVTDVVSRALRSFVEDSLIEVTRSQITILDLDRLKTRAGIVPPT